MRPSARMILHTWRNCAHSLGQSRACICAWAPIYSGTWSTFPGGKGHGSCPELTIWCLVASFHDGRSVGCTWVLFTVGMCRDRVSCGFSFQLLQICLCLTRHLLGDDKTSETVPLGVSVFDRSQRPFGELVRGVAEIANLVAVCLELKMILRNELLNLFHEKKSPLLTSVMLSSCMSLRRPNWKCFLLSWSWRASEWYSFHILCLIVEYKF